MNWIKSILSYLNNEEGRISGIYERYRALHRFQRPGMRTAAEKEIARRRAEEYQRQQAPTLSAVPEATAAMQTTQQRAAEDRERALAEWRSAQQQQLAAVRTQQQQAVAAMQAQQQQAMTAMQPWQQQIQSLQAQPEAIGAAEESQMFEATRVPIEAQTQALLRGMQEQYYPGGFRARRMQEAVQSKIGQLAETRRKIGMERTLRRRQDLMALTRQQAGYGQAMAGIYGRTGMGLADIYGTAGRTLSGIYGQGAGALAGLYGQTIAKVPEYAGY